MSFTGPGKGSQFVKTKYDPNGLNPLAHGIIVVLVKLHGEHI